MSVDVHEIDAAQSVKLFLPWKSGRLPPSYTKLLADQQGRNIYGGGGSDCLAQLSDMSLSIRKLQTCVMHDVPFPSNVATFLLILACFQLEKKHKYGNIKFELFLYFGVDLNHISLFVTQFSA